MKDRAKPLTAPGYTKPRGGKSERNNMMVEAQHQTRFRRAGKTDACVFIRVGVAPRYGDRPLDDLAENSVQLTLEQASAFAEWILAEVAEARKALKATSCK